MFGLVERLAPAYNGKSDDEVREIQERLRSAAVEYISKREDESRKLLADALLEILYRLQDSATDHALSVVSGRIVRAWSDDKPPHQKRRRVVRMRGAGPLVPAPEGRPPARTATEENELRASALAEKDRLRREEGCSATEAEERVAAALNMSDGSLDRLLHPRKRRRRGNST